MITKRQKAFLKDLLIDAKVDRRIKSMYLIRIQEQIEKNIENLIWLCENQPDIFEDRLSEYNDDSLPRRRRVKALLKAVKLLMGDEHDLAIELTLRK